ncbi:calcium-binding protein [Asticcacaulis sp. AC402]|uniref:beta strand repeat-containing protein n=1 Tax=Asticcacaulis sp. AC402 TaxID=1282361 RepID=UPI0003C3C70F|nr:calcium-binding protein [Asticcacaulis sp. AC402]ESQ73785.1 hypothetical protein ABAC402_17535 [Asticcacaulis sp. AC402]
MAIFDGTPGNDTYEGTALEDSVNGAGGNDILRGGGGGDVLDGGDASDQLYSNVADWGGGWDSGVEVDSLNGGSGNDELFAGYGDYVDGGANTDILLLSLAGANAGVTADLTASFSGGVSTIGGGLLTGLEQYTLILGSSHSDVINVGNGIEVDGPYVYGRGIYGNDGNDTVFGGSSANSFYGEGGNDVLNGLGGNDRLYGGIDNDILNGGDASDYLYSNVADWGGGWDTGVEIDSLNGGSGNDELFAGYGDYVDGGANTDILLLSLAGADAGVTADLTASFSGGVSTIGGGQLTGLERYTLILGSSHSDVINVGNGIEIDGPYVYGRGIYGNDGNDTVFGGASANSFYGEGGNDVLNGLGGNDRLYGGIDNDSLNGGDASDYLYSNVADWGGGWDTGVEIDSLNGASGNDELFAGYGDYVDGGANTDILLLSLAGADAGVTADLTASFSGGVSTIGGGQLTGLERYTLILGSSHSDVINVGNGIEIDGPYVYGRGIYGNDGNDTVFGGSSANSFYGEGGNDVLNGLGGNDRLYGGIDNDSLNGGDASDYLYSNVADWGGGWDTGVEIDSLNGGSGNDELFAGYGDYVDGGANTDILLLSLAGADTGATADLTAAFSGGVSTIGGGLMTGLERYTLVLGSAHSDVINVGNGIETGGPYVFGTGIYGNDGNDTVSGGSFANSLLGQGGNDVLYGLGGNDALYGGSEGDILEGGAGDDTLNGGSETDTAYYGSATGSVIVNLAISVAQNTGGAGFDTLLELENLTGSGYADTLVGNDAANVLDGGNGNDTLSGGIGDDTYYVQETGDKVVELGGEGTDTIFSTVNYSLNGRYVETLTLTGTANTTATGNSLANTLNGNVGNNVLDGAAGNDTMAGGMGDDTYYVQATGDNVIEAGGAGTDLIYSSVTYTLAGRFAETLNLTGTANINATGNSNSNTLIGNDGNNTLNGKAGADKLTGGLGADIFLFEAGSAKDIIFDFSAAQNDTINVNAYTGGVANAGLVAQVGGNVVITFSASNTITVIGANQADVLAHMVW